MRGSGLLFLLALQALSPPPSPSPSPKDERLQRIEDKKRSLEKELGRLRGEEKSLLGEVEALGIQVRLREQQVRGSEIVLQKANEQMDQTVLKVRGLERSVAEARPLLAARARALYKLGELSYLRLLLSVDRPSDILRGYRFVTALARRDNERIASFRASLESLKTTRSELEERTRQAMALRAEAERARRELELDRKRKTELLTSIVEKKELHLAYVQELEDAEGKLKDFLSGLGEAEEPEPLAAFKGSLPWPTPGRIRVAFGKRRHPKFETYTLHNGIEIEAPESAPVLAVHDGTVVYADRFQGYGLMVAIDHGSHHHSLYAHLLEISVQNGQRVSSGERVGSVGQTELGASGLYFEIRYQGQPEDPLEWLRPAKPAPPKATVDSRGGLGMMGK